MDPILLQKQIRDNSEDLGKYITDLQNWQDEMKRKEKEMYGEHQQESSEELPPVRSKIKTQVYSSMPAKEEKPAPRIKSNDYTAWEKFDVEKACEAVDKTPPSKNIEEANYEKENGNTLVKAGKWQEAMECYSRAISHDGTNAIYYANRAQCALKLDMWQQVVSDCTKALSLEAGYVKALLRRATAYSKLKNYEGARIDLQQALQLEPRNSEVKNALTKVLEETRKQQEAIAANTILAISKPPHLRSKAPLKRIPVEEVGGDPAVISEPSAPVTPSVPSVTELKRLPSPTTSTKPEVKRTTTPTSPAKSPTQVQKSFVDHLPLKPKTSVQFMLAWSQVKPEQHFAYLQQIPGNELAQIFGDSLESKLLSEVLSALSTAPSGASVFQYLQGLTEARRFSTLTLFMTKQDQEGVRKMLQRCVVEKECTQEQADALQKTYEL
ncbi:hypothetical protein B566_EDAN014017 [Ephemera danica]|nr:hypothetical protein B566_EDAN014017 [Ephemera danica]